MGRLSRFGPNTITDMGELLAELDQVRSVGYATKWEELHADLCPTAAPGRGSRGTVIAALSASTRPSARRKSAWPTIRRR